MACLRFDSGPRVGERVELTKPKTVFGRQETCDCVLMHPTVSREHFLIEHSHGKYFAVDRGSGNGTIVNGDRVTWAELKDGDRVQAGPFAFIAELGDQTLTNDESRPGSLEAAGVEGDEDDPAFTPEQRSLYPREYLEGIRHFNAARYFEAHEVWEEVWLRSSDETKVFYQMLIQAAVGLHHHTRGNTRGTEGMYKAVNEKLARLPAAMMSLDLSDFGDRWISFFSGHGNEDESSRRAAIARPRIELLPVQL